MPRRQATSLIRASTGGRGKSLVPLFSSPVSAGFPTPADDEVAAAIDMNELLIHNKPSTYLVRVQGNSLTGAGILNNDILILDASLTPVNDQIVVARIDGEFLVKRYSVERGKRYLKAEHADYPPIALTDDTDGAIVGVVTGVVRTLVS